MNDDEKDIVVEMLKGHPETRNDIKREKTMDDSREHANPLCDSTLIQRHNIIPWVRLDPRDRLLELSKLGDEEETRILVNLQKYGICQIRWSGAEPTDGQMQALEMGIGKATSTQNDFVGKIKAIIPKEEVTPNTGDSSQALGFHVDGTQHEKTPAILVFQYHVGPQYGGYSTFVDMAYVLSTFTYDELAYVLRMLSRHDCAKFSKKGMEFSGPMITPVCDDRSVACRFRFDDVVIVNPACEQAFKMVADVVNSIEDVLTFKPREGDMVIFDNWRLVHGRGLIQGRHNRHHNRMWIENLRFPRNTEYTLGIRPLDVELVAEIKRNNI